MGSKSSAIAQHGMRDILDSCPVRPRHYGLWGLAAGGTLLDGMSLAALAIALPLIKQTYSMSPLMIGAVSAGSVVGMAVGAMAGGWTSDRIGRRHLFLISMSLIAGFSIFNLMMNMGPNSTTFGLPALLFPSEIHVTAAGFSAACAKIGATLGTLFLPMLGKSIGLGNTLALMAGISGLGFVTTAILGAGLLSPQVDQGASAHSAATAGKK